MEPLKTNIRINDLVHKAREANYLNLMVIPWCYLDGLKFDGYIKFLRPVIDLISDSVTCLACLNVDECP